MEKSMYKLEDLNVGDTVVVNTWGNGKQSGTIVEVEDDIKNGMPGISYDTANGEGFWCYLDQISEVKPQVKQSLKKKM